MAPARSARWFLSLAALATAGALTVSGCGSSSSGSTGSGGSTPASTGSSSGTSSSSAPLHSLLPAKIQQAGQIVVGSAINYPPFENYSSGGQLVGFEVELANALQGVLGVKFEWKNAPFDSLFSSLTSGRYDIVYGATNDTPQREQSFKMVDYLQASQGFDVAKGNPTHIATVDDLCGKSVSAVTGGIQAQWLASQSAKCTQAGKPKINTLTFSDASGEELALREGKAQAMLENYPTAVIFAKQSNGAFQILPNLQVAKTYFAMVVPKNDPQLITALQKAWDAIIKNGSYGQILSKWGLSGIALKQSYVDGATTHPAS
jgi:polar amino acid transport system substrate-binding protein